MSHAAAAAGTTNERDELLDAFWDKGLVLLGGRVREEYGLATPIFIDLRHKLYDDLLLLRMLGERLHAKLRAIVQAETGAAGKPQEVIGIPDTATPIALVTALVSKSTAFPLAYGQMRKKPAAYPGGESGVSAYMGTKDPNRQITLIDDVMASGRTKIWAMEQLAKDGIEAARVLVVVDREQGGGDIVEGKHCPLHSLYKISDVIGYLLGRGMVSAGTANEALEHIRARRFS